MEERKQQRRTRVIRLRVSQEELQAIQTHLNRSTHRSLSEYLRRVALNKPVTVKIRNVSADNFLSEVVLLREDLEKACLAYTAAVAKLQCLQGIPQISGWLQLHESTRAQLLQSVSRIELLTAQLYEQWLQK